MEQRQGYSWLTTSIKLTQFLSSNLLSCRCSFKKQLFMIMCCNSSCIINFSSRQRHFFPKLHQAFLALYNTISCRRRYSPSHTATFLCVNSTVIILLPPAGRDLGTGLSEDYNSSRDSQQNSFIILRCDLWPVPSRSIWMTAKIMSLSRRLTESCMRHSTESIAWRGH